MNACKQLATLQTTLSQTLEQLKSAERAAEVHEAALETATSRADGLKVKLSETEQMLAGTEQSARRSMLEVQLVAARQVCL